jgi:RHS repeat-associated protein
MMMPGREYQAQPSRFGFNGKENDNDVKGFGNQYDYGNRILDSRLGRFLSIDPLQKHFPWFTPYQFSGNSPILCIDLDGLEPKINISNWKHKYTWATQDYHDDGFTNYFSLEEKDEKSRPFIIRTRLIGMYPYSMSQFQYYDYDTKNYEYFTPTGFTPEYLINLKELESIGEFGRSMEKGVVVAATFWNPFLRNLIGLANVGEEIDKRGIVNTKARADEIHRDATLPDRVKKSVLTVAVADAETQEGYKYRLVSLNSASYQDQRIRDAVAKTLKPNEILIPNILGGDAHAEENLREYTKRFGLTPTTLDTNRPFCKNCSEENRRNSTSTSTTTSKRDPKTRKMDDGKIKRN